MSTMAARDSKEAPAGPEVGRILLAEDDEEMRSLLAACLEASGHIVDQVVDGDRLLESFEALRAGTATAWPDLVVTDVQMPGCNGLGAVAQLRQWNPDLAVIVITAFGDARVHERARELDVRQVLDKPFDLGDFIAAVEAAVADA
jgi:CheY-like chemotaxis protein